MSILLARRGATARPAPAPAPTSTYGIALAAAAAGTGVCKIGFLGDSLLEGEGASARANRALDQLIALERTRAGVAGSGLGLTAPAYATYLSDSSSWRAPTTSSGSFSPLGWFGTQGDRGGILATNAWKQYSVTGDAIDVVYLQSGSGGGTGTLRVIVDGSTVANITTATGSYTPGKVQRVSLGSAGAHTVRIQAISAQVAFDGIQVYNGDSAAGITYWDGSHTAYDLSDFVGGGISADWRTAMSAWGPHLIVCDLVGSNEYLSSSATPSSVASALGTLITWLKSIPSSPTILFMVPFTKSTTGGSNNGLGYNLGQYYTASINAINSAGGCEIVDLRAVYPSAGSQAWYASDDIHWNNTGHAQAAAGISGALALI